MKRFIGFSTLLLILFAAGASAFGFDTVKEWLGGVGWVAVAAVLTFLIGLGAIHKYTDWLANLFIALGTGFLNFGLALKDGKITGDELKQTIADVKIIRDTALAVKTTGG